MYTLWKFVQNDSAYSLIAPSFSRGRNSGHASATPAHAASTWYQMDGYDFTAYIRQKLDVRVSDVILADFSYFI